MEIVNIEAGTFREMVISIQLLKEKLENLKGRKKNWKTSKAGKPQKVWMTGWTIRKYAWH